MSIKYDHKQAKNFIKTFKEKSSILEDELSILSDRILYVINNGDFQGEFAEASKSYLNDAVLPAIDGFKVLLEVYTEQYDNLLKDSIDKIDKKENARISSDDITELNTINENLNINLGAKIESVNTEVDNVKDIVNIEKLKTTKKYSLPEVSRHLKATSGDLYEGFKTKLQNIQDALEEIDNKNVYYEEIESQITLLKQLFDYMDGVNSGGIATYNGNELKNKGWYSGVMDAISSRLSTYPDDYFIYKDVPPPLTASEQEKFTNIVAKKVEERDEEWFNNLLNNASEYKLTYYSKVLVNQSANSELFSDRQNNLLMMSNVFSSAGKVIKSNYSMKVKVETGYTMGDRTGDYLWVKPNFEVNFNTITYDGITVMYTDLFYDVPCKSGIYKNGDDGKETDVTYVEGVRRGHSTTVIPGNFSSNQATNILDVIVGRESNSEITKSCIKDEKLEQESKVLANLIVNAGLTIVTSGTSIGAQLVIGSVIALATEDDKFFKVEGNSNVANNTSNAHKNLSNKVQANQTAVITNYDNCFEDDNLIYVR